MKFNFENLDDFTRKLMQDEINYDIEREQLYLSKRFNDVGQNIYKDLLYEAVENGDEETLASSLNNNGCFKSHEERKTKSGVTLAKVPENANVTLAESEFNRFYIRGLCLRAIQAGQKIQIYRARHSDNPRAESITLIDKIIEPEKLLSDLRTSIGIDTVLGLPPGPNSGLSVKLI